VEVSTVFKKLALVGGMLSVVSALALTPIIAQDAKGKPGHGTSHDVTPELQQAINDTAKCHEACEKAIEHCLQKGGKHAAPEHLKLLIDCAEICKTDLGFMARQSDFHGETCAICANICRKCAESCEKLASDDPVMKEGVEACRKCAESCGKLAKSTRGS
jgi:hypothetical protein